MRSVKKLLDFFVGYAGSILNIIMVFCFAWADIPELLTSLF